MAPKTRSQLIAYRTRSSARAQKYSSTDAAITPPNTSSTSKRRTNGVKHVAKRARRAGPKPGTCPPVASERANDSAKLAVFMNLPVDIFLELAKYLHPLDLVFLSRVNKFFRELLMSRKASPIWRSTLRSVPGLPPCPKTICEPQYAAMLFTKMCSSCGKGAPRNMDPIILVRLCTKCCKKQAVDTSTVADKSLVFSSYDLVPGNYRYWCLDEDARAVDCKLNELIAAGDTGALMHWEEQRREEVNQRTNDAEPLMRWLEARDRREEAELNQIKRQRRLEIESRLTELGWEDDITSNDDERNMEWSSLVCITKPLTNRVWNKLLPKLLTRLKVNREERLQRELLERRSQREYMLQTYLYSIKEKRAPFAHAHPKDPSATPTNIKVRGDLQVYYRLLPQPFPSPDIYLDWPEFQLLLEPDMPTEDFRAKLDEQRDMLTTAIVNWKNAVEAHLVTLLPKDTSSPMFNNDPNFTLLTGTGDNTKPIGALPVDLRKLLRADATFRGPNRWLRFYPDDFEDARIETDDLMYNLTAAKIAKALLNSLGQPDAAYLGLKDLSFYCGRCNSPPKLMCWGGMIEHYLDEANTWYDLSATEHDRRIQQTSETALVFTHNVDLVNASKPFIRVYKKGNEYPGRLTSGNRRECKLCLSMEISWWLYDEYVIDHVRDVHLIEEPELGKHYVLV